MSGPKHHCGLFGVFGHPEAARLTYYGLYAQQHRGQESAGIASTDRTRIVSHRAMGLVFDVFKERVLQDLTNPVAVGHVRYSTTGSSHIANAQPLVANCSRGQIAVAHNGNLVNAPKLRAEYEARGAIFHTTTESEIVIHMLADTTRRKLKDALFHTLRTIKGSFSLLILVPGKMIAIRDPHGIRPLCIGKLDDAWIFASETCALDQVHAKYIRDVKPGEAVFVDENGLSSEMYIPTEEIKPAYCIFEHVYFARPDSYIYGENVHKLRERMGRQLARETGVDADIVVAVPDSGRSAAFGYAKESGIAIDRGFIRNHYVGRTFIQPLQKQRSEGVELKLNVVREVVQGKRVVVVDDSIIRGTTSRSRARLLYQAGAKEVHVRIACPPHRHPCFFGIDFPNPEELVAHNKTVEDIRDILGVDSMAYLSLEGMLKCTANPSEHYCTACFTGDYPEEVPKVMDKFSYESVRIV